MVPPSAASNRPALSLLGPREGALHVPEEFALQQPFRQGRAVDGDKRLVAPSAQPMHRVREHLLARAALAEQQHRAVRRRHLANQLHHPPHRRRLPHQLLKHRLLVTVHRRLRPLALLRLVHRQRHVGRRTALRQIEERPVADALHRPLDHRDLEQQDQPRLRILLPHERDEIHVHGVVQIQIQHDHVVALPAHKTQHPRPIVAPLHRVAALLQETADRGAIGRIRARHEHAARAFLRIVAHPYTSESSPLAIVSKRIGARTLARRRPSAARVRQRRDMGIIDMPRAADGAH